MLFNKKKECTFVVWRTAKMDAFKGSELVGNIANALSGCGITKNIYNEDGTVDVSFKCTKKEFEFIEKALYCLRRNQGLGVMTLVSYKMSH